MTFKIGDIVRLTEAGKEENKFCKHTRTIRFRIVKMEALGGWYQGKYIGGVPAGANRGIDVWGFSPSHIELATPRVFDVKR